MYVLEIKPDEIWRTLSWKKVWFWNIGGWWNDADFWRAVFRGKSRGKNYFVGGTPECTMYIRKLQSFQKRHIPVYVILGAAISSALFTITAEEGGTKNLKGSTTQHKPTGSYRDEKTLN